MRRPTVLLLTLGFLLGACHDDPTPSHAERGAADPPSTTATTTAATTAVPAADPCALGPQAPPAAAVAANFATALAFAPDGRLFFAERSGTVRVFQDGAPKEFAKVATVTTENGGGYSEPGPGTSGPTATATAT